MMGVPLVWQRFFRRPHTRLSWWAAGLVGLLVGLILVLWLVAHLFTGTSQLARVIAWGSPDIQDYQKVPRRVIHAAPPVFYFTAPTPEQRARYSPLFEGVNFEVGGKPIQGEWDKFMQRTDTVAFLVIQNDVLLYEGYFNGYDHDATVTSFSIAKSWVSALAGIAIDEGYIDSLEDPITKYVPELLEKDPRYANIRLRHLISMSSGIRFEEKGFLRSDGTDTYYSPDLRMIAISSSITGKPGQAFLYNDYNPLLIGLVLERTTGRPVAQYLEEKIWSQIGMEADGSWSLDSKASGFEKMGSGLNGRAIDFAKLGRLYLNRGDWNGKQIIPPAWIEESTRRDTTTDPADIYQYFWWVDYSDLAHNHYFAAGKYGQYIYIIPEQNLVLVRFGCSDPGNIWPTFFEDLGRMIAAR